VIWIVVFCRCDHLNRANLRLITLSNHGLTARTEVRLWRFSLERGRSPLDL